MKIILQVTISWIIALNLILSLSAYAETTQAKKASDFIDTIGISGLGVQFPYFMEKGEGNVKNLKDLHVKYARSPLSNKDDQIRMIHRMARESGAQFILNVDKGEFDVDEVLNLIKSKYDLNIIVALEGHNEPFGGAGKVPRDKVRIQKEIDFHKKLYAEIKRDPLLKKIMVLSFAPGDPEQYPAIGDMRNTCDEASLHSYTSRSHPENGVVESRWIKSADAVQGHIQYWVTETGYHTKVGNWGGVPEEVQAKYVARMFANNFLNPRIRMTMNFNLMDNPKDRRGNTWGITRADGSRKPSYDSMKNLVDLLNDKESNFRPESLDYDLVTKAESVKHFLLQKADKTFYLVAWCVMESWDNKKARAIPFKDQPCEITFDKPVKNASLFRPAPKPIGGGMEPLQSFSETQTIQFNLSDQVAILALKMDR